MRYPFLFTLSLLLSLPPAALAQDYATTRKSIQGFYGFSVNSFSGNLHYSRNDLFVPGRGLSLDFTFYYNSSESSDNFGSGLGWSHSYDMTMSEDSLGVITLRRAGGRSHQYTRVGGDIVSAQGVYDEVDEPSPGVFRLTSKNGMEYHFEGVSHPGVTRIRDRFGNEMTLSYEDGHLASVTDVGGRTAALTYNDDGLVTEIRMVNTDPERWVYYGYEGEYLTSVTDAEGYQLIYGYTGGRLTSMQDKNGNPLNIGYSPYGAVTAMRTCSGEKKFDYNSTLSTTSVVEKVRDTYQKTSYVFENGRLIEEIGNCCGFRTQYDYDANGNVSKVTDANGNATLYFYDDRGNMIQEINALGDSRYMTYDPEFNQVTSSTDWKGNTTSMYFSEMGLLDSIVKPLGVIQHFVFDEMGQLQEMTTPGNSTYSFQYDGNGNLIDATDELGVGFSMVYDDLGQMMSYTDKGGYETLFNYDLIGQIISETHDGGQLEFVYDGVGNLIGQFNELGAGSSFGYDEWNRLIFTVDAIGGVDFLERDELGNVVKVINRSGVESSMIYNQSNQMIEFENGLGNRVQFEHDLLGNILFEYDVSGSVTAHQYDVLNRLVESTDELGVLFMRTYDSNGNLIAIEDGDGVRQNLEYDALNRVTGIFDSDEVGSYYDYDVDGNLIRYTDPTGRFEEFVYDSKGRLIREEDSLGVILQNTFDSRDYLQSQVDANGNEITFERDFRGSITKVTQADGRSRYFEEDSAGRIVLAILENGDSIAYEYDDLDRVVAASGVGLDDRVFGYDELGNIRLASTTSDTLLMAYDALGRLSYQGILNGGFVVATYDDQESSELYEVGLGRQEKRLYDARGRLISIVDGLSNDTILKQSWTMGNRLLSRTWPESGRSYLFAYDSAGELVSISGEEGAWSCLYARDSDGRIISEMSSGEEEYTTSYEYDGAGRLVSVEVAQNSGVGGMIGSEYYQYDQNDNIVEQIRNGDTVQFEYNAVNQLEYVLRGGQVDTVLYDLNGNLIYDGVRSYEYDSNGQLVRVDGGFGWMDFHYDGLGRRIRSISDVDTVNYSVWKSRLMRFDSSTNGATELVYGDDVDDLVSMVKGDTSTHVIMDARNAVREIFGGENVFYSLVGAYGAEVQDGLDSGVSGGAFTGNLWGGVEGVTHMRNRDYVIELGRFLQRDPLSIADGPNLYSYVHGDPINNWDPYGLRAQGKSCYDPCDNWTVMGQVGVGTTSGSAATSFTPEFSTKDLLDGGREVRWKNKNGIEMSRLKGPDGRWVSAKSPEGIRALQNSARLADVKMVNQAMKGAAKVGGGVLNLAGAGIATYEAVSDPTKGKVMDAVIAGVGVVGSVMVFFPPTTPLGTALVLTSTGYGVADVVVSAANDGSGLSEFADKTGAFDPAKNYLIWRNCDK